MRRRTQEKKKRRFELAIGIAVQKEFTLRSAGVSCRNVNVSLIILISILFYFSKKEAPFTLVRKERLLQEDFLTIEGGLAHT